MSRVELFERIRRERRDQGLSIRALAERHRVHRRTVRQALESAVPPARTTPERQAPVLGGHEATIRRWLQEDQAAPPKQRHTARRVWRRLCEEQGAQVAESTVRAFVAQVRLELARDATKVTVPQEHAPGEEAEVDFVQAGVGIHLLTTRPAQAVEALRTIKQISDQGLTDVKTVLGVLRADDDPDQPRTPPGGLDQLDALLDPVRAAGVQPQLTVHGSARPLPPAVDLAAYRIIQEALTNVLRHARARTAWLDLRYEPERVVIGIRDDGSAASPGQAGSNGQGGHGISGMRERALALSGQFTAGPHPDGGFQVRCALPTPDQG